jgi:type VI secretion system protein
MSGHSLLTRIRRPELAAARREVSDAEVRDSVLEHLKKMCMTRMGTMVTVGDYGIVDLSEIVHSFPDAIALMAKTLRHSILTYEPRLVNVQIKHIPASEDLNLRFEIVGVMMNGDRRVPVKFETLVDPKRRVSVR